MNDILLNHFLWCKKEGRDTSWYEKDANAGKIDVNKIKGITNREGSDPQTKKVYRHTCS